MRHHSEQKDGFPVDRYRLSSNKSFGVVLNLNLALVVVLTISGRDQRWNLTSI